jgi:acetolactate synthase I/III small subunit
MNPVKATSYRLVSVFVCDEPGVMTKLTSLLQRRGFVVDGISAGKTKESELLRLTIRVKGDDQRLEQIRKQVYKLVETVRVTFINPRHHVQRELALIKIRCSADDRAEMIRKSTAHNGRIVDIGPQWLIVEMTAEPRDIDSFIARIPPDSIVEIARSGIVAMNAASRQHESVKQNSTKRTIQETQMSTIDSRQEGGKNDGQPRKR